jgi:hypothetical protein
MEKQAGLQETEVIQYEDTHKKAFSNRRRKESARLGIKSKADEGLIADEREGFE